MTIHELSQLYWLDGEIRNEQERLRELESRAHAVGAAPLGKGPHGSDVGRKTEQYGAAIADLKQSIEENIAKREEERIKLTAYIDSIDDSLTREIFRRRFAECRSWAAVAHHVGGGNTVGSVKKRVYRYLGEHKED